LKHLFVSEPLLRIFTLLCNRVYLHPGDTLRPHSGRLGGKLKSV
jgi:hypothetical protein